MTVRKAQRKAIGEPAHDTQARQNTSKAFRIISLLKVLPNQRRLKFGYLVTHMMK
jgi:hypothetical protein